MTADADPVSVNDARTGWVKRPPLTFARAGFGVATAEGRIFAIGGFDPKPVTLVDSVEVRGLEDPGTWQVVAPMLTARGQYRRRRTRWLGVCHRWIHT